MPSSLPRGTARISTNHSDRPTVAATDASPGSRPVFNPQLNAGELTCSPAVTVPASTACPDSATAPSTPASPASPSWPISSTTPASTTGPRSPPATFIATDTSARLAAARSFFAFARRHKLVLIDPTAGIERRQAKGFAGHTLDPAAQRRLLRRWTNPGIDPIERTVGLLCLLHAASTAELRTLTVDDTDLASGHVRLGRRPHPVPLDPATVDALTACLTARAATGTANPHVIVTRGTRAHADPASAYFLHHALDPAGIKPTVLRHTRIADLAHRTDPRLVATALGMTEEGAMHYLTDAVDHEDVAFRPDL